MQILGSLKARAKELKQFTLVAYYAARDPRTPTLVRVLALLVAAYALSPIDLIPDFIPVIGYLDDLILVPLGLALVVRLTPGYVLAESRERGQEAMDRGVLSRSVPARIATLVIILRWLLNARAPSALVPDDSNS